MSPNTAIILAGGLGTRLRSLVSDVPKPMAPVNDRPFLEWLMDYWISQGVVRFIISVGYKNQVMTDCFGSRYRDAQLDYAIENEPMGTGGGLLNAISMLGNNSPSAVLNGDTYFGVTLSALTEFHHARKSEWTFSVFKSAATSRYMGMTLDSVGRVLDLKGGQDNVDEIYVNGGVYVVDPVTIKNLSTQSDGKLSLESDLLPQLMTASGSVFAKVFDAPFIDIGVPDDYARASNFLKMHNVQKN